MQVKYEFRVDEKYALLHLPPDVGARLGDSVRKVVVDADSPLVSQIIALQREYTNRDPDDAFYTGWDIHRTYAKSELAAASCYHLQFRIMVNCAGEEFGTVYDESTACPVCGAGAKQVGPLILDHQKLPKRADCAYTLAYELVVSEEFREAVHRITAPHVRFDLVRPTRSSHGVNFRRWYQLQVIEAVDVSSQTICGTGLDDQEPAPAGTYDMERGGRCPACNLIGFTLLSEVHLEQPPPLPSPLVRTRQLVGGRFGLFRPHPLLICSPAFRSVCLAASLKGVSFEIARPGG